jgi:hypothetical protein
LTDKVLEIKNKYKPGQASYESCIAELEMATEPQLATLVANSELREIGQKAQRQIPKLMPFDPSKYYSDEDKAKAEEAYNSRLDEHERQYDEKLYQLLDARIDELSKLPKDRLIEMASPNVTRARISNETEAVQEVSIIMDCFREMSDHSKPYFESEDQVPPPGQIRQSLLEALVEVNLFNPVDIKNSLGRFEQPNGPAESSPAATTALSTRRSRASTSRKKNSPGGDKQSSTG